MLGTGIFVLFEGPGRLIHPPEIPTASLAIFGAIGLISNLASFAVLWRGRDSTFNLPGAFLDTVNDALGSAAVLTAHVVVEDAGFFDGRAWSMIDELQQHVAEHFDVQIGHSTFQLERGAPAEHEYEIHP